MTFTAWLRHSGYAAATAAAYDRVAARFRDWVGDLAGFFAAQTESSVRPAFAALVRYREWTAAAAIDWDSRLADLDDGGLRREVGRRDTLAYVRRRTSPPVLDFDAVFAAAYAGRDRATATALMLGYHAGLRHHEMLRVIWDDIDLVAGTLTLTDPKGSRPYAVPLNRTLRAYFWALRLEDLPPPVAPVVNRRGRPVAYRTLGARLRAAGVRPHDLRRVFATRLLDAGVPLPQVSRLLNHRDPATTIRYYCPDTATLRGAVDRLC